MMRTFQSADVQLCALPSQDYMLIGTDVAFRVWVSRSLCPPLPLLIPPSRSPTQQSLLCTVHQGVINDYQRLGSVHTTVVFLYTTYAFLILYLYCTFFFAVGLCLWCSRITINTFGFLTIPSSEWVFFFFSKGTFSSNTFSESVRMSTDSVSATGADRGIFGKLRGRELLLLQSAEEGLGWACSGLT